MGAFERQYFSAKPFAAGGFAGVSRQLPVTKPAEVLRMDAPAGRAGNLIGFGRGTHVGDHGLGSGKATHDIRLWQHSLVGVAGLGDCGVGQRLVDRTVGHLFGFRWLRRDDGDRHPGFAVAAYRTGIHPGPRTAAHRRARKFRRARYCAGFEATRPCWDWRQR